MSQHVRRLFVALALLSLLPTLALACLWDSDTLRQERSRFPTVLELVTGKFLRHSPEFYQWRIKDRQAKLKTDPNNVALYDDLAVAYSKTGQHDKAIETILAKEAIQPGLYETYSNLGTFYILAGEFEIGLPYIDKALAINPDAHFGREKYQRWLVEYALEQRVDGKLQFPLQQRRLESPQKGIGNFYDFVAAKVNPEQPRAFAEGEQPTSVARALRAVEMSPEQLLAATQGVLGMMRFANHENPLLLETLGDLLEGPWASTSNAQQLAARCYLRAGQGMADPLAKDRYQNLAANSLSWQLLGGVHPTHPTADEPKLPIVEKQLATEMAEADAWYGNLNAQEHGWIANGQDPEAEFDKLYAADPEISAASELMVSQRIASVDFWINFKQFLLCAVAIVALLVMAATLGLVLMWARRRWLNTTG